jgi:hypothetical protein
MGLQRTSIHGQLSVATHVSCICTMQLSIPQLHKPEHAAVISILCLQHAKHDSLTAGKLLNSCTLLSES